MPLKLGKENSSGHTSRTQVRGIRPEPWALLPPMALVQQYVIYNTNPSSGYTSRTDPWRTPIRRISWTMPRSPVRYLKPELGVIFDRTESKPPTPLFIQNRSKLSFCYSLPFFHQIHREKSQSSILQPHFR